VLILPGSSSFIFNFDMASKYPVVKFGFRLGLVGIPALVWMLWQWSLPLNQYTFRAWEALTAEGDYWNGTFFPNQRLELTEMGDLGPYTGDAVPKRTVWETDEDGYRNASGSCKDPEGIVVGDSTAAGSSLSQEETVTALLGRKRCVRSFAGSNFRFDIEHAFNLGYRPKWIYISVGDYVALPLSRIVRKFNHQNIKPGSESPIEFPYALTLYSRLRKNSYWNYRESHGLMNSLRRSWVSPDDFMAEYPFGNMPKQLFDEPESKLTPEHWSHDEVLEVIVGLDHLGRELEKLGTRLIVSFFPRKNSVYTDLSGVTKGRFGTTFLDEYERSRKEPGGVHFDYFDLIGKFQRHYEKTREFLHHSDDTHWNPAGVRIAVDELEKRLSAMGYAK
jgi:hypothetical protein